MAAREELADQGEPIIETERNAIADGDSIRVNLTSEARDIHDIQPRDELQVQIHVDHIRIYPEG